MMDLTQVIKPTEYTLEIVEAIATIEHRMQYTCTDYQPDDIKVFAYEGTIYVLGNPVLGKEPIYDEFGSVIEYVPKHNITVLYPPDWLSFEPTTSLDAMTVRVKVPKLRIIRPELCVRIAAPATFASGRVSR